MPSCRFRAHTTCTKPTTRCVRERDSLCLRARLAGLRGQDQAAAQAAFLEAAVGLRHLGQGDGVRHPGCDLRDQVGQALLVPIREMARWVDDNLADLGTLAQQPALGTSHGAEAMKPFVQEVATDNAGFLTMLQQFRASLVDAEAGVIGAMNNYRHIDTLAKDNFRA